MKYIIHMRDKETITFENVENKTLDTIANIFMRPIYAVSNDLFINTCHIIFIEVKKK